MNKQQAKKLIRDTFESPFDKERFIFFIKNLLNKIEEKPFSYQGNYIPDLFKPYISKLERIGKYYNNENEIDLLIVSLKKETSLQKARTIQRNFIAWYLKGSRGGKLKDAALVAFVSPDEEDWRFSLVKMDYRWEKTPSGMMKVKEEFTPARRWSFLVGKNEKSHTAQSRLVSILEDDEHNPTLKQLEEAFNIEPVTKEFFEKYRNLLIRTVDALDKIVARDSIIKKDFASKNINTVDFAKKLLGQIVFLYFLQKKGWFGVARDADWGTGPKDFLRRLFNKEYGDYKNFFNDILEPLFYEALARQRDDDFYSRFNCKIPFLNGGLFEPIGGYDWVHTDIILPDELFSNTRKTPEGDIGDGILDVFDRFNFTVKEDEPLEKEVAIDPELLGKLYEKFNAIRPDNFYEYKKALASGKKNLEKQFNKKFGVYYTPREIVHYMCQQSLIYYLESELQGKVSKEDIEKLIKYGEQFTENETTALLKEQLIEEGIQKGSSYKFKLPESIRKNARLIDDKLKSIKICDPAIGSGAFPVGMMHEIVKTRNVLSAFINESGRTTYNFKRECIENSLYGVDIDAGACEVAKLRLWLSLIVDEEDIKKIKPLPNLDYKIVQGNSLLRVEKDLFNMELFNQLEKLKSLYFNETNPAKKQEYKNQIEELINKITKGHKEFDFEVYFSEVFHEKGGFDVVIANPPYVNVKRGIRDSEKQFFKKVYRSATGQFDLFALFIEKSFLLALGNLSYIVPKPFINNENYEVIRTIALENGLCEIVIGSNIFEAAEVESCVFFASKRLNRDSIKILNFENNDFHEHNSLPKKLCSNLPYKIVSSELGQRDTTIIEKLRKDTVPLSTILDITRGVECGKNDRSITDTITPYKLITGSDLTKYCVIYRNLYIHFDNNNHKKFKSLQLYKMPKILIRRVANDLICTFDDKQYIVLNTIYCGIPKQESYDLRYITATLNSSLISFWFKKIFVLTDKLFPYVRQSQLSFVPVKKASTLTQDPFIELVNKILSLTQSQDYLENPQKQAKVKQYERQIDQLVYKLYGLTEEEIKIVENSL